MSTTAAASGLHILDISAALSDQLVTWPGVVERFERQRLTSVEEGDPMTVSHFRLGAHAGTHVDAPNHFLRGAGGIETLPLEAMIGPAYVVAVAESHPTITADVLERGGVPENVTRLLAKTRNSGWSSGDQEFREDYVAFDESAAAWCLERGVSLVGIDYLSIEPFDADARGFPVHTTLLGAGVVIVESLDLAGVEPGVYELIVAPLLVPGSDGAPARALLIDRG